MITIATMKILSYLQEHRSNEIIARIVVDTLIGAIGGIFVFFLDLSLFDVGVFATVVVLVMILFKPGPH